MALLFGSESLKYACKCKCEIKEIVYLKFFMIIAQLKLHENIGDIYINAKLPGERKSGINSSLFSMIHFLEKRKTNIFRTATCHLFKNDACRPHYRYIYRKTIHVAEELAAFATENNRKQ